jgi:hypothetical protein
MKKKEIEYYDEIATELATMFKSNLDHDGQKYVVKTLRV